MEKKKVIASAILIVCLITAFIAISPFEVSGSFTGNFESLPKYLDAPFPCSYIIDTNSTHTFCFNGTTWKLDESSSSNRSLPIQNAINTVTSAGGLIFVRQGNYVDASVIVTNNVVLMLEVGVTGLTYTTSGTGIVIKYANGYAFMDAPLNMTGHQIVRGVFHSGSTPPSNPSPGEPFFDTDDHTFYVWNSTAWVDCFAGEGGGSGWTTFGAYKWHIYRSGSTYYYEDNEGNQQASSSQAHNIWNWAMGNSSNGAYISIAEGYYSISSGDIILPNKNRFIWQGAGMWGNDNQPTSSGGTILLLSNGHRIRDGGQGDSWTYDLELRDLSISCSGSFSDSPIDLPYTVVYTQRTGWRFYCSLPSSGYAMEITSGSGPPGMPTVFRDFTIKDERTGGTNSYVLYTHAEVFVAENFDLVTNPTGATGFRLFYLNPVSYSNVKNVAIYSGTDYNSETLTSDASSGQPTIQVGSTSSFYVGQRVRIWDDSGYLTKNFDASMSKGDYKAVLDSTSGVTALDRVWIDDDDSSSYWTDIEEIADKTVFVMKGPLYTYSPSQNGIMRVYPNSEWKVIQSKTSSTLTFTSNLDNAYTTANNALIHVYPSTYEYVYRVNARTTLNLENVEIFTQHKVYGAHFYCSTGTGYVTLKHITAEEGGMTPYKPSFSGTFSVTGIGRGYELSTSASSISDGDTVTFPEIMAIAPASVIVQTSVSAEWASVTAVTRDGFTVAIKQHDGSAGTTQTIYYMTAYKT